jgi:hypothetical protein
MRDSDPPNDSFWARPAGRSVIYLSTEQILCWIVHENDGSQS